MKHSKKLLIVSTMLCALAAGPAAFADTHSHGQSPALEESLDQLPKDKAEAFRDHLQQAHEDNKDLYTQVHQIHEDMHHMLMADSFDQNAFTAKGQELRQVNEKIAENLDNQFAAAIAELTPSERKRLATSLHREHAQERAAKTQSQQ